MTEDMERLEDMFEALWTMEVNIRRPLYLSSNTGLQQVATFRPVGISPGRNGPSIKYITMVYKKTPVMAIHQQETYTSMANLNMLYYLQPGHSLAFSIVRWRAQEPIAPSVHLGLL
jgi:hypothetical protein